MPVVKVIELVGASPKGLQNAVEEAVTEASKTVRNLVGVDVLGWTGKICLLYTSPSPRDRS